MFNQTQLNGLNYAKKTDLLTGHVLYIESKFEWCWQAKVGHLIENILISCSFNGDECTPDDFVCVYDRWWAFILNDFKK